MKPWLLDAERFNCNPICFAQLCRCETLRVTFSGSALIQKRREDAPHSKSASRKMSSSAHANWIVNAAAPSLDLATALLPTVRGARACSI